MNFLCKFHFDRCEVPLCLGLICFPHVYAIRIQVKGMMLIGDPGQAGIGISVVRVYI